MTSAIKPKSRALHIALLFALCALLYANTLSAPFILDDNAYIINNPMIRNMSDSLALHPDSLPDITAEVRPVAASRRVVFESFAINYALGGLNPMGYHLFNIMVHSVSASLLYAMVIVILRTPRMKMEWPLDERRAAFLALGAGVLFACHPIQTQGVTYITQRFASMSAMFGLGAMVAYGWARITARGPRAMALYAVSFLCVALAMQSKETSLTLPVMMGIFEFTFFDGQIRGRLIRLAPYAGTMLIVPLGHMDGPVMDSLMRASTTNEAVTRWTYLITQFVVITRYISLIILPVGQNLDHDQPLYQSLLEPRVLGSGLALAALLALGLWVCFRRSGRWRVAGFGVVWFFVALSVESSVVPLVDLMFEHRVYMPSAGFFMAVAVAGSALAERRPRALMTVAVIVVMALCTATVARNAIWGSELSIWQDTSMKSPGKARPLVNYGFELYRLGRLDEAGRSYESALRINPKMPEALLNYGLLMDDLGRKDQAETLYLQALEAKAGYAQALHNLGALYLDSNRAPKALIIYKDLIAQYPFDARYQKNLGSALFQTDQPKEARAAFERALRLAPDDPDIYFDLGFLAGREGRIDDAITAFEASLRLNPKDTRTQEMLNTLRAVRTERARKNVVK